MDPAIATILGAILGALLTGPLTYYFTKRLAGIQSFDAAGAKLRAAFAPAQSKITTEFYADGRKLREFFYEALPVHAAAIEEFRPFAGDGVAYQKAWKEYQKTINHKRGTGNDEWAWVSDVFETEAGPIPPGFKERIINTIDNILHFASPVK